MGNVFVEPVDASSICADVDQHQRAKANWADVYTFLRELSLVPRPPRAVEMSATVSDTTSSAKTLSDPVASVHGPGDHRCRRSFCEGLACSYQGMFVRLAGWQSRLQPCARPPRSVFLCITAVGPNIRIRRE